ncbi:hypothetical protein [Natrarchaeobius oligotrophus]|uniref:hypothetical protein n=1 Tax=Natrarchaeobius oligotrophus TaxID=3455743 RepID=UPI000F52E3B1|nr:hypothetical protein [Natrarchaeobius chitinivorans]
MDLESYVSQYEKHIQQDSTKKYTSMLNAVAMGFLTIAFFWVEPIYSLACFILGVLSITAFLSSWFRRFIYKYGVVIMVLVAIVIILGLFLFYEQPPN